MKLYLFIFTAILFSGAVKAQENDIEIFEKKDGNKNVVFARNVGKVDYLVTLNIEAKGMDVQPGIAVEGVVPSGYMKQLATLEPKPGVAWSYGYDVSFVEYTGGDQTDNMIIPEANSNSEVTAPEMSESVDDSSITVYTRSGCSRCALLKKELTQKKITFKEIDVNGGGSESSEMWKLLRETGFTGTTVTMPVVKMNGELHYNIKDLPGFIENIKL